MKIKRITNQHRRDFSAIIICEECSHEEKLSGGYDDSYYHDHVLPNMKCRNCEKSRRELNVVDEHVKAKYPDWMEV